MSDDLADPWSDGEFGITGYIRDSDQCAAALQPSHLTASVAKRDGRVTLDFLWDDDAKFLAQFEFPEEVWHALHSLTHAERARLAEYDALRDKAQERVDFYPNAATKVERRLARVGRGQA